MSTDHAQWDYGGRTRAETSVKVTCCHYDGLSTAVKWGDNSNPANYLDLDTTNTNPNNRRYARHCPPEEVWFRDDPGPYVQWVEEGSDAGKGTQAELDALTSNSFVCFKNRTVVAQVLMASIDDYNETDTAIADAYTGISNKTTSILYKDKVDDVWDQDKSETSFYQLCAADRDIAVQCCMHPTDPSMQDKCPNAAAEHSFTPLSLDDYRARDFCETSVMEDGVPKYGRETWIPSLRDFVFYKSVILNVVHRPYLGTPSSITLVSQKSLAR